MIGECVYVCTKKHGAKLFQSCYNRQHFFLYCGIILLGTIYLLAVIGNRAAVLHNAGTHWIVGQISVDVEPLIMIQIGRESAAMSKCILSKVSCILCVQFKTVFFFKPDQAVSGAISCEWLGHMSL